MNKPRSDGSLLFRPCGLSPVQFHCYKPAWKGQRKPSLFLSRGSKYKAAGYNWLLSIPMPKGRMLDIWSPRTRIT